MGPEDAVTAEDDKYAVERAEDTSLTAAENSLTAAEKERSRQYSERLANLGAK